MYNFKESLIDEVRELQDIEGRVTRRLRELRYFHNLRLRASRKGNSIYYTQYTTVDGQENRTYLGKDKINTVAKLQEYHCLSKILTRCRCNIKVLNKAISGYQSIDPDDIIKEESLAYQGYGEARKSIYNVPSASEWLDEKQRTKASYPPYKPQFLRHMAADGTMCRSKAEVITYNELLSLGLTFIYECPLRINNKLKLPDFIVYDPRTGQEIIIEYYGKMMDPSYSDSNLFKMHEYYLAGYTPGVNFIMFFDDCNGNIDAASIRRSLQVFAAA